MNIERKTITAEELSRQLGVSLRSIYEACRNGHIAAHKLGKVWLIPKETADRLLTGNQKAA